MRPLMDIFYRLNVLFVIAIALTLFCNAANAQPSSQAMQMRLNLTIAAPPQICLPFGGSTNVSVRIYWGDGAEQDVVSAAPVFNVPHQYNSGGVYDIFIDRLGPGPRWLDKFSDGYDCWYNRLYATSAGYLVSVTSFGELGITSLNYGFTSSYQLTSIPSVLPATVTDLGFAFTGSVFNHLLPWDVSRVTNMEGLFLGNSVFNQPLNTWDVSRVTSMSDMFHNAASFNQPLDGWSVGRVTSFQRMFKSASFFDGAIGSWNTSSATNMAEMFDSSAFNQNINNWDVSNVRDMSLMFRGTPFDQPLDQWDVGRVTDFFLTFGGTPFNQPINSWNMASARSLRQMFESANSFNQPLDQWNVSSVTNMNGVFNSVAMFNQPINTWNVSNVRDFSYMFQLAGAFNQRLEAWDVRKATNMVFMFYDAAVFQQDLSTWCAPLIPATPDSFAPTLSFNLLPRWGDCSALAEAPVAGPAMAPVTAPVATPFAAPVLEPPVATPFAAPVLAPTAAPVQAPSTDSPSNRCATTSCITQNIEIGANSSSNIVTFRNTTTIIGDLRITTPNATIVLTVTPSTTLNPNSAPLQISGCVTFGGRLNVTIAESVSLSSSQELTIATYDAGYCDGNSETSTKFESVDVDLGCRTTTGTTVQYNAKSLSLAFGEIKSDNCPNSVAGSAPSAPFPLTEVVAGCVAGVVAISIIVAAVVYWKWKNRINSARKAVQSRLSNAAST